MTSPMAGQVADIPHGSVVITPAAMYEEMQKIGKAVDRLSVVIDPAMDQIRSNVAENKGEIVRLASRVRVLEAWRWTTLGAATVLGTGAGIIASAIQKGIS